MSSEDKELDDKDKDKIKDNKDINKDEEEIVNPLNISDDDFDDVVFTDLEKLSEEILNEDTEDKDKEKKEDIDNKETSEDLSKNNDKIIDDKKLEGTNLNTEKVDNESLDDNDDNDDEQKNKEKEESSLNFEEEHKKLLTPFRANNKDMQVDSVDEARTLMKMGANYNKKMAGLKPSLKIVKMLENNDLLDEEKISYLIDLDKKNPEAIKKFIKESGIDPLELDLKEKSSYKTNNTYTVNDKEVELDGILDEIQDTESFNNTIDIIGNKWDESSKAVLRDNPGIIKVINEHVATGIYDKIDLVITKERALGNLNGLSDIEAYKQVGDAINDQGGFDTTESKSANTTKDNSDSSNSDKENKKKTEDPKLRERKKAASSTKNKSAEKSNKDFNPLSLSDEDFDKVSAGKFL